MKTYKDFGIDIPARASGEVRVVCPDCTPQRKPSNQNEKDLAVNTDKGTWHCHHCGWSGGLHEKAATEKQEQPKEYQRPTRKVDPLPEPAMKWFSGRGISADTLRAAHVGFAANALGPRGAIVFPRYKDGEVIAHKYRTGDKKMWQSKAPEPGFFNRDNAIMSGSDTLIITEGEIDALSFIEAGFPNVVSVPDGAPNEGAKNIESKMAFLGDGTVDHFDYFVIASDADAPGKRLEIALLEKLGRYRCLRVSYPPRCKDVNDALVQHGKQAVERIYKDARFYPIDGLFTASDIFADVLALYDEGLRPGLETGWSNVDELYRVRTCEMTVITGIPGSGKSTWLDALTVNMNQQHGWKIAFCSPENWPIQRHAANIIEKIARAPFAAATRLDDRATKDQVKNALHKMDKNFFFTQLDENKMCIDGVLEVMQAAISRHNVNGIVLDPWNELEYHRPSTMTETDYVSLALGKIRRFARNNNVHVWIVAHPKKLQKNEDGKYPPPTLYDISGSAHWYNKADNGIAVFRPNPNDDVVHVLVQKIRFRENGQLGCAELTFHRGSGTYQEPKDYGQEPKRQHTQKPKTGTALDDIPF